MKVNQSDVAKRLRAMTPEDLLAAYRKGQREFSRSNLLRPELEAALRDTRDLDCIDHPEVDNYNPLWVDFRSPGEQDFEWDRWGRCLFVHLSDLPAPRRLSGAVLPGINLSGSYLYPIDFSEADLSGADLRRAVFIDCALRGARLTRADLRDAQFFECNLTGVDLYMARMERVSVVDCDAQRSNLQRAKLRRAHMTSVNLRKCNLANAHCERIALHATNLRDIDLSAVRLPDARVFGSTISKRQVPQLLRALDVMVR
jgi:uncharacterized protein YjbI with pentapeptide repeats